MTDIPKSIKFIRQVKTWFQNRRMKHKKHMRKQVNGSNSGATEDLSGAAADGGGAANTLGLAKDSDDDFEDEDEETDSEVDDRNEGEFKNSARNPDESKNLQVTPSRKLYHSFELSYYGFTPIERFYRFY